MEPKWSQKMHFLEYKNRTNSVHKIGSGQGSGQHAFLHFLGFLFLLKMCFFTT
jgi:hypothetical protein